jgi:hypothetical protein
MKRAIGLLAVLAMVLGSSTAFGATARVVEPKAGQGDYEYDFFNDHLQAGTNGAEGAIIRVRDKIVRRTLIRPRISFVSHLLKSVEDI